MDVPSVLRSLPSLTAALCLSGGPACPTAAPGVTQGGLLSLQVQLAETEAFSLNSDRSSSILLGDDLSLEDPAACPVGPRDGKVSTHWAPGQVDLNLQPGLRLPCWDIAPFWSTI